MTINSLSTSTELHLFSFIFHRQFKLWLVWLCSSLVSWLHFMHQQYPLSLASCSGEPSLWDLFFHYIIIFFFKNVYTKVVFINDKTVIFLVIFLAIIILLLNILYIFHILCHHITNGTPNAICILNMWKHSFFQYITAGSLTVRANKKLNQCLVSIWW